MIFTKEKPEFWSQVGKYLAFFQFQVIFSRIYGDDFKKIIISLQRCSLLRNHVTSVQGRRQGGQGGAMARLEFSHTIS